MLLFQRVTRASKQLGVKVRPIVTSVRHGGRLLFSDRLLLYTNTGLSAGLSVAGDVMEQNLQHVKDGSGKKWDKIRTFHMAASGLAVGPVAHFWYLYLDRWFPGRNAASLLKKVALDQLAFTPVYITMFLVTIGVLEGQGWMQMKEEFKDTGVSMFVSDLVVWTPAQTVNFYFVPARFRVLFDNCVSLAMDTWYSYLRFDRLPADQMSSGCDKLKCLQASPVSAPVDDADLYLDPSTAKDCQTSKDESSNGIPIESILAVFASTL